MIKRDDDVRQIALDCEKACQEYCKTQNDPLSDDQSAGWKENIHDMIQTHVRNNNSIHNEDATPSLLPLSHQ